MFDQTPTLAECHLASLPGSPHVRIVVPTVGRFRLRHPCKYSIAHTRSLRAQDVQGIEYMTLFLHFGKDFGQNLGAFGKFNN